MKTFGPAFSKALCEVCGALSQPGWPVLPEWVCAVLALESGFDPHAHNASGAFGLWQKMPEHGIPYQVTDPVQQLRDYCAFTRSKRNTFSPFKRFECREGLYLANLAPARLKLGQTRDIVVYAAPGDSYSENARSFGKEPHDPHGVILVSDLAVGIDAGVARCRARYDAEVAAAYSANARAVG